MSGFVRFLVILVLVIGGIFAVLRATCISFWTVPSDDPLFGASVMPTLEHGDVVALWRLGSPGYAELVRCADPEIPGRYVVGRILGEPGDHLTGSAHSLWVNKRIISSAHACQNARYTIPHPVTGEPVDLLCEEEETGGNDYTRLRLDYMPATPETFDTRVPPGHVFLISDNRAFHNDSREFGAVAKANCKERIFFRLWSVRGWGDAARRLSFVH